jgi:ribbon-helix-helix protein, copG family
MANSDLIIKPKRAKGDDGYKTFSIRIKEETVSRLNDISAQTGYSRNELIGVFLEYAIENCIIEER